MLGVTRRPANVLANVMLQTEIVTNVCLNTMACPKKMSKVALPATVTLEDPTTTTVMLTLANANVGLTSMDAGATR